MGRSAVPGVGVRALAAALAGLLLLVVPAPPARAELVGSVSGVVTAGGEPVEHAWVSVVPVSPTGQWAGQGVVVATDANGRYRVQDVYTDFVKVQVRGPVGTVTTYWPSAFTFAGATALRVTGSGARADVDLPRGGSLRGRVVDAATGRPVPGARVTAQAAAGQAWDQVGSPALGSEPEPGTFALVDLPPVPVALWVHAPPDSGYLDQWFDGAGFIGRATWFDGAAATAGVTVRLRRGAELSGTVRDDRGAPIAGATVAIVGCGLCPLNVVTDEAGRYRIAAVPPGRGLLVRAAAEPAGYLSQWFREPGRTEEARIDLVAGQVRGGVDLALTRGAFVSLSVLDEATGAPLRGVAAQLESQTDRLLGFLPSTRDRLVARAADEPSSGSAASPAGASTLLGVLPGAPAAGVVAGAPGGAGADAPASGAGTLTFGPVPPGRYRVAIYPGRDNPQLLPVTWGSTDGMGRDGEITLVAGQRLEATVRLVASGPRGPEPGIGRSGGDGPGTAGASPGGPVAGAAGAAWPGLATGFLAPPLPWGG